MASKTNVQQNKKILIIIDEDHYILKLIEYSFKRISFEVIIAVDEEDVLKKAEEMPDIILLDTTMTKLNGYETARKLKNNNKTKNIPKIMFIPDGKPEAAEKAFEAGAADCIGKPINLSTLMEKISKVLG